MVKKDFFLFASIKKRALAAIIDFFIFWCTIALVTIIFGKSVAGTVGENGGEITFGYSITGRANYLVLISWLVLFPIVEGITGSTLGKKIIGVKVANIDNTNITVLKSFLRHVCDIIDFYCIVGILVAKLRSDHRRIGDLLAGTVVVDIPPVRPSI